MVKFRYIRILLVSTYKKVESINRKTAKKYTRLCMELS